MLEKLKMRFFSDVMDNKVQYLVLVFFLIIGITAGTFTLGNMKQGAKSELSEYINMLFIAIKYKSLDYFSIIFNSFLQNTVVFAIITMFSFAAIGILVVPIMLVIKGFCVGFTVGVLSLGFISGGFWAIVFCTFLPNLILLPCLCKAGVMCINNSIKVFKNRKIPKTNKDRLLYSRPHLIKIGKVYLIFMLGIGFETLLIPALTKLI